MTRQPVCITFSSAVAQSVGEVNLILNEENYADRCQIALATVHDWMAQI